MFSSTTSSFTVNPEEERAPPPPATVVYFPQNDVEITPDESWRNNIPNLFAKYSHISKPSDVRLDHLAALNIEVEHDVDLEILIPASGDGIAHLPPPASMQTPAATHSTKHPNPKVVITPANEAFATKRDPLLSNGTRAPERDTYLKFVKELICENDDALRIIWRKKARPGHPAPHLSHFRKFWGHLESLCLYWDTSLDQYYELDDTAMEKPSPSKSSRGFKRLSIALVGKDLSADAKKPTSNKRYKGRRTSTGSRMPEHFRVDAVRNFIEPIAWAFGCQLVNPRKTPQMEIRNLLLPVTQTSQVWRNPQEKANSRRGITEGPVMGIQCRAETNFIKDKHTAVLDAAREVAGLMLLAQERARESKTKTIPGQGKWYTTKPRWGGGPGGEFGEAEGNTDPTHHHSTHSLSPVRRYSLPSTLPSRLAKSEEDIWKELKPGPGLWEARHNYLAVGKDRGQQFDSVFMVSSLFHHIAIVKLYIHPLYVDFLISGKAPSSAPPNTTWYVPQVQRSRWYDLFVPEDRVEAMRGLWGVMSYMMRSGETVHAETGQRQKSDSHHHFPFRKKSHAETGPSANRSASVHF